MAWLLAAAAIAVALVGGYALAGGTDYKPDASPDPCAPYHWPDGVSGATAIAEQVGLSALGGAACDLGVSREELTLAFADQGRLDAFEKKHGFSQSRVDEAARSGLNRAVDEGEQSRRVQLGGGVRAARGDRAGAHRQADLLRAAVPVVASAALCLPTEVRPRAAVCAILEACVAPRS